MFEVLEKAKFQDKYRWIIFSFENSSASNASHDKEEEEKEGKHNKWIVVNQSGESFSQIQNLQDQVSLYLFLITFFHSSLEHNVISFILFGLIKLKFKIEILFPIYSFTG